MELDYSKTLSQPETLSRAGEGQQVRKILADLNCSKAPRRYRSVGDRHLQSAQLRCGANQTGMKRAVVNLDR